jgi:hypothetical protein
MSSPRRLTLRLDLDLASDPIEGELWEPTGLRLSFSGWLGLADALERASDRERHVIATELPKEE